jgi:16S rRNA (cytosine967-C5)-methyltransferase
MTNSLAVAIEALSWMAYAGIGERAALFKAAGQMEVKRADELRQAHRLIMETTRYKNRLDYLISQATSAGETVEIPHGIRNFLRITAYLKYVEGANRSELVRLVTIARQVLGWRELQPFEKQTAEIIGGTASPKPISLLEFERLSLETCHPAWYVERLVTAFGRSFALQILRRDLQPMDTYVRVNSLKASAGSLTAEIGKLGGSTVGGLADVFHLGRKGRPSRLIGSGEMVIQDLASIVAGYVSSPSPGENVLDLCAAPGNKTTHLAAQMHNEGKICSIDISPRRLSYWKKGMNRCGCQIATPIRADARRIPSNIEADVVLVDPPCSNTGVFARNPGGKWNLTTARVNEFTLRQYSILHAASRHVAQRGRLVYCTCSILPEEDEYVVELFLRTHPEFKLVPQSPFLGSYGLRSLGQCQRFFPHIHECNGYFIAKLKRTD